MTVDMTTRPSWGRGRRAVQLWFLVVGMAGRSCGASGSSEGMQGFGRRRWGMVRASRRMVILRFTAVRRLFSPFSAPL